MEESGDVVSESEVSRKGVGGMGAHRSLERKEEVVLRSDRGIVFKEREVGSTAAGAACVPKKLWGKRSRK